jgi:hypothetical protein
LVTVNKIYGTLSAISKVMRRHGVKNNPMAELERKEKPAAHISRYSFQCLKYLATPNFDSR